MPGKRSEAEGLPTRLTTFVGRQELLAKLRPLVRESRLTTLVGAGGSGKTRLALEVADQVHRFFDDVRVVTLRELDVPDLLLPHVAKAVGVRDTAAAVDFEALLEVVASRGRLLLVLDNCEHLRDTAGTLIANLVSEAPQLHVLATSQAGLSIPGEQLEPVPPLEVPASAELPVDLSSESVQLLIDRAAAKVPGWSVTEANWAHVVRMLRLVSGIPLFIELAVSRLQSMSVDVLADRLATSMERLLNRGERTVLPHHQRMSGGFGWSYDLCDPQEQLLWERATVFRRGGFDLAAAEAVCADERLPVADIADALAGLVDKSLVIPDPDRSRYVLLEPTIQYGLGKLQSGGDEAAVRTRHRDHYLSRAVADATDWPGPGEVDLLHGISADMPNFRAAIVHALDLPETAEIAQVIMACLGRCRWIFFAAELPEALYWFQRIRQAIPAQDTPLCASALAMEAFIAICLGMDHAEVEALLDQATEHAERSGVAVPAVLFARGAFLHFVNGTNPAAMPPLRQAFDQFTELGEEYRGDAHMAHMFIALSAALLDDGEDAPADSRAEALRIAEGFLAETERVGAPWSRTWGLWAVGIAHARAGDPRRGMEMVIENLRLQMEQGDRWGPVFSLPTLAWLLVQPVNLTKATARMAAILVGASLSIERITGIQLSKHIPHTRFRVEAEKVLRETMPADDYADAVELGAAVKTIQDALRLTLGDSDAQEKALQDGPDLAAVGLTERQWEIARLVAQGKNNKQIAAMLSLSPRTVESHVQKIYLILGLFPGTRAGLTNWVRSVEQRQSH
ncbi:LuxR C-terminal-related transcriptional regulator [Lentzea terrae]|uniref:LuxR C-terminal-related transcriptional regulator n=1 Tax=Lentzea terrae TaxID=2200761 RepID=UPI000DD4C033|nr:LuxR C-terminal-related transcriptional regulator [Lentzea terrae]